MTTFSKIYVGKGQAAPNKPKTTRITLRMEELQQLVYEFKGQQLVTLEVAEMKSPDDYNRTHTVYGTRREKHILPMKWDKQRQ